MLKYQKGYIFNGLTFVVNKEDVHNAKDEMFVEATALLPMPDPPANADRIRAMSDEELAEFLLSWVECDKEEHMCAPTGRNRLGTCNGRCINGRINWLRQPAEEG